jgi:vacuolar-type H+-ATPase subunit C/Vma6
MIRASANDLDYLATRLHARRSRMAEHERLDELCRARSLSELGRAIFSSGESPTTIEFQRRLAQELADEISDCLKHLDAADQDFTEWLLTRFQIENAKILLRSFLNQLPLEMLQPHLIRLPSRMALEATALLTAKSLQEFAAQLPSGYPRSRLQTIIASSRETPTAFILEAALDAGYFQELFARNHQLRSAESEIIRPLISQEANLFQFQLVARGKFHFGIPTETLSPLFISRKHGDWLNAVLSAPDILSAAKSAVGIVFDELSSIGQRAESPAIDISFFETLGWQRYLRLANLTFRRSHMGVGAVAAYFGVRRIEIANLITLSESIRLNIAEREARARMLPRSEWEASHV